MLSAIARQSSAVMAGFVVSTTLVQASGLPTIDIANIIQTTTSAFENIEQTSGQAKQIQYQLQQIQQITRQIDQIERDWNASSGSYQLGALLNTLADRQQRRYLPTDWEGVLDLGSAVAGNAQTEAVSAEARKVREEGERYTQTDLFQREPNSYAAQRYGRYADSIYGSMAIGRESYKRTADRLATIEELSDSIDTSTDMKAAIDLNNRLLVELSILLTESIRIQSAQQTQMAESRQIELNDHAQLRHWTAPRENGGLISLKP